MSTLTSGPAVPVMSAVLPRRAFLAQAAIGAAALGLSPATGSAAAAGRVTGAGKLPVLMKPGHQHDHSENTLRALAAFGVTNICSGQIGRKM